MNQSIHNIAAGAAQVTILLNEHAAFVQAADADLVAPLLRQKVNSFVGDGPRGVRHVKQTEEHFARDQRGLMFFSGLVPRVRRALEQRGCRVVINDQTDCQWLNEAWETAQELDELSSEEQRLLAAVCGKPHGQLVVSGDRHVAHCIALMAEVFSSKSLMVVAKNRDRAARLHCLVSDLSDRRIALYPQLPWKLGIDPWATIGTATLFGVADLAPWQVVVFADVESVFAKWSMEQLDAWRDFLCYAFVPANRRLADCEKFRLEELVGPVIYRQPSRRPQQAKVDVVLVQAPSVPLKKSGSAMDRKRVQIWSNDVRNRFVADLAQGIQRGWRKWLIAQRLFVEEQTRAVFLKRRHPTVSILVENAEHGEQLQRLLRSWKLLMRNSVTGCLPAVSSRQIATMVYATEYGVSTDVLIRADGGVDWPLSAQSFPRASLSPDHVVVVDFEGRESKRARRTTHRLRRAYHERGWNVIGRSIVGGRHASKEIQIQHELKE